MTYTLQSFTFLLVFGWLMVFMTTAVVGGFISLFTQSVAHEHDLKVKIRRGESDAIL